MAKWVVKTKTKIGMALSRAHTSTKAADPAELLLLNKGRYDSPVYKPSVKHYCSALPNRKATWSTIKICFFQGRDATFLLNFVKTG